ncbi:ATP-dependent endonuclease [Pseudomonas syringae]|uniref:Predicted ATP-dependent endonuclease of the OLD family, contains P-loop ATPase and TOPRIM domains n=1 Tax=Pseudomonas syringae TaxID=317 RepID=A0AB37ZJ23_PSESX|nr:ATP-dependent endonuclease [Pseudomonas syringae]AKF52758.1 putative ATP-dependent endonuclease of the OLDfamily [Pseudomonas syringae pv. syringae HS191]MBI6667375.1 AAA family ATPase [Pseudomonas syringae]MBI6675976.1 AAA family ATPase [Pseudomonas syringae]MBI6837009.1 AAA family ATPase [Pseudomonas syringae]MDC6489736.1 ATP-dependent endonuclease [Pseudomonas syringae]
MHLHSYRLKNFRRLKDAHIELADDISIFVGSNNSGKTSATQAIHAFVTGGRDRFTLYDFNSTCWKSFDEAADIDLALPLPEGFSFPSIDLDLWFEVAASDLYLVIPLLPSTAWEGSKVGIRVSLIAKSPINLIQNFQEAKAKGAVQTAELPPESQYIPWPRSITDYLQRELKSEYELRYFILDHSQFDESFREVGDYVPDELGGEPGGGTILKSLIHIDNLGAQRHLADPSPEAGGRSEDLSKRLSRFYKRNLNQRQDDHIALKALFDSEQALNIHLDGVFKPTLDRLAKLGYPGVNNPRLKIMSALDPAHVMSQDARVHYQIGDGEDTATLPDSYNGLGFKNLIYMVVEILDSQARWATMDNRPPLHLLFVEEPEAHLHAQLQQVFIRNILELLNIEGDDGSIFGSQMVITTHSPHILYERGFKPIRYFRRKKVGNEQLTEVLNLSAFYQSQPDDRDFLERYLKLTHCDLFFSDAAILVEGNVERLLLPVMIRKSAKTLRSACLCILEVGGAFGHRFQSLIEFLGLTTLIITDIDSVALVAQAADDNVDDEEVEEFEVPADAEDDAAGQVRDNVQDPAGEPMVPAPKKKYGKACLPSEPGAATSNQTLIKWLPGKLTIEDLRNASEADKTHVLEDDAKVRVAYQTERAITWNGASETLCGRTLEEDFGLENPDWSQAIARKPLGLIVKGEAAGPAALAKGLNQKVSRKSFDKTKFALAVLTEDEKAWHVPTYIRDGLVWLKDEIRIELETVLPDAILIAEEDLAIGGKHE